MKPTLSTAFVLSALAIGVAGAAEARPNGPLQIPRKGEAKLDVNLEISLADGAFFEPVALAPDFYYGVTNKIAFGIVHTGLKSYILAGTIF